MIRAIKKFLKENYKFIIFFLIMLFAFNIKFPYYIDAPGGISDVSDKIVMDKYESKGSFNLAYVKEYNATIPTLILSLFNKDWKVLKKEDVILEGENDIEYTLRDKIFINEAVSNAIYVAYKYSNSKIDVTSSKLLVTLIKENANTNLKIGDEILKINDIDIIKKEDISDIINNLEIGDKIKITCISDKVTKNKYAYIIEDDGNKKIGMAISNIKEYNTVPSISVSIDKNESGSSGGLIMALSIYNSLTKEDITKGLKIVGTGTIDLDGNVGSIGGVEYKLKSAVKENADLFIVPVGENLDEALELKDKYNYNINIVGVSTFEEVINYLDNINTSGINN